MKSTDFTDDLQPSGPSGSSILAAERAQSDIDTSQLAHHLLNRDGFLKRQARVLKILESQPIFAKHNQLNMSRPDRYHLGLARAKTLRRLSLEHNWDMSDYLMADYLVDEMSPYFLQSSMFGVTVREQGDEEQKAYWLPKIDSWEIIGCYGQTELGHGSNVKGVETQARWDPETKEFVLHSPALTASKWWNGALGRTANHAVVVAQLMLPDKDGGKLKSYGPHQFILQIRDMKTHEPLPGIVIGDIGPKYGYTSMDNGYMLFNEFRVSHKALLSRYSGVDSETGAYMKPENPATVYGSLTYVRAKYVNSARLALARAVTIAIRYTAIRRQFADRDVKSPTQEEAVLNYPTVQIRLLPLLATTFALHYTGEAMLNLYWKTRASIEKSGDFSRLKEMHAQSSGLKSLCTMLAADGIETCRRALGGHGFGGGSGFIPLNSEYLSKPTVEGDNWMITQQTASYLIKRMEQTVKNPTRQPTDQVDIQYWHYTRNRKAHSACDIFGSSSSEKKNVGADEELLIAFSHRASFLAHQAYTARVVEKRRWTDMMVSLHQLAQAHSEMLLVRNFHAAVIASPSPDPALSSSTLSTLKSLYRLFALSTISTNPTSFLLSGVLTLTQLSQLPTQIQSLMNAIRPHAVKLVDAWSVPDYLLQSALGRYDGDVYNDLFRKAHKENPLNSVTFNPDWRSEEIIMGEGEENARKRILELVKGTGVDFDFDLDGGKGDATAKAKAKL